MTTQMKLPANVYPNRRAARDGLETQPFTLACRARHVIVPVYERNLIGEKTRARPIGYAWKLA
jgi:hypothetical protein